MLGQFPYTNTTITCQHASKHLISILLADG